MLIRVLAVHLARIILMLLVGGLLGAALVRLAPAYGVNERELDGRFGQRTIAEMRAERSNEPGVLRFYLSYLAGAARGDLGWSSSLNRPVAELIGQRLPVSAVSLGAGVLAGALAGLGAAVVAIRFRLLAVAPAVVGSICLSLPAGVIALLLLIAGVDGQWALALVLFPHTYGYSRALLASASQAPHVVAAHARGIAPSRILFSHVLKVIAPQLIAVLGLAISIGFPALVPIEVVSDTPGVLQLAWKGAMSRDMPVLVNVTLIAAAVVMLGNAASDVLAQASRRSA
jgi:peptide/nickel transport system permease protein